MSTPLMASIISCKQRTESRNLTIRQLEAVGITPVVFLSPCEAPRVAGRRENALVSARALRHAVEAGADLLFMEDDIDLAPDFNRYLTMARKAARITYLYLHDIPAHLPGRHGDTMSNLILNQQPIPAGLHEIRNTAGLTGAQCVYIPHAVLSTLPIGLLEGGRAPIDIWLYRTLSARHYVPLVALPHPVQHRQVRVGRQNPTATDARKYSLSFALERRWSP